MYRYVIPTLAASIVAVSTLPASAQDGSNDKVDIIPLNAWNYDEIYRNGWSAQQMLDEAEVYGPNGEEIGTVENIIIGPEGELLSIIAQVGGFWDIGDTHVNIPWDIVEVEPGWRVEIPITEETAEDFSLYADEILATSEAETIREVDDDVITAQPWKATDLINDYARLADGTYYGYVSDLIFDGSQLTAVVATPDTRFGPGGYRAYPFRGYGYGFDPRAAYYDFPYDTEEVGKQERFTYDSLQRL